MSIVHYQLSIEMKNNERDDRFEKRLRFVVRHYKEGGLDEDKARKRFAFRQGIRRQVAFRRYWMAAASVVLLLIGFGTFYMKERNKPEWVSVVTVSGQLKDVYLPDSTLDSMAGNSTLRYDVKKYGKERRVVEMTGKALSSFYEAKKDACPFSLCEFVILPDNDRKALRDGIRVRFEKMLELGLIDEVKKLKERGDLSLEMPSMRSVGYRQVWEYLDGVYDYDTMIEKAVIATARLAKHQMTWLRGGLKSENRTVLDYKDPNNLQKILNKVCNLQD